MGIYEERTHEHFGILRNFFHGSVVDVDMMWLGSLTWFFRCRVVGPRCIGGTTVSWRGEILWDVACATIIVAWTPCSTTWVAPIDIG
jgi:hypothetical protein